MSILDDAIQRWRDAGCPDLSYEERVQASREGLCEACGFREGDQSHTGGFCREFVPPITCVVCRETSRHPIHDIDFEGGHPLQPEQGGRNK